MKFRHYACNVFLVYIIGLAKFSLNPYIPDPQGQEYKLIFFFDFILGKAPGIVHDVDMGMNIKTRRNTSIHVSMLRDNWYHSVDYDVSLDWWKVMLV